MILKKDISHTKSDNKNIFKNNFLIEESSNNNFKYENLNQKSKEKSQKMKMKNFNQNIFNKNKKPQKSQVMKNKKGFYENSNNMSISTNNINISLKKNVLNNRNDENISNNIIKKINLNNNIYSKIINCNKSKIDEIAKLKRKYKAKNSSMEERYKNFSKDICLNDNFLLTNNDDKYNIKKGNNIYFRLYNIYSPSSVFNKSYMNKTNNNNLRKEILSDNINKINNHNYTNENIKQFYNSFYEKINYNSNRNNITYSNDLHKTENNFYKHKTPIINIKNNNYLNYIKNKNNNNNSPKTRGHINSMIIEDKNQILSPFENYRINNNYLTNDSRKRSKNKIKITKISNPNIVEYNLDISDENDNIEEYNPKYNYKYLSQLQKDFIKDIRPETTNRFIIYGQKRKINIYERNNCLSIENIFIKRKNITNFEKKSGSIEKLMNKPNLSEVEKTSKSNSTTNDQKNETFNKDKDNSKKIKKISVENKDNICNENTSSYKILVKKRPKNEISITSNRSKRRNSSSNIIFNNSKKINNKNIYEIYTCENININPRNNNFINKDKLNFNNEEELIDYINKIFKEEIKRNNYSNKKLEFTGFVLTKIYKGKNICEIRIEDNIEKINKNLQDEQVTINDKNIELIYLEDKNKFINYQNEINKLHEDNIKLRLENENIIKKELNLNELIKKLDEEKFGLIDKNNKLSNEMKNLQDINDKLIEENKNFKDKLSKNNLFQIQNNSVLSINSINVKNNINNENIDIFNSNENCLINNDKEKIKNDENCKNLISDENKYIIGHIIINDNFEYNNIIIQNQNHPKINDLVEEGMSDEELK